MAIITRNKLVIFLLIIFSVGSICNDSGFHMPDVIVTTTRITECATDNENNDPTQAREMTNNLPELGTQTSLQPIIRYTEEDVIPDLRTHVDNPGHVSKIHKCGFIDSCFGRCGSGPSDPDSIYTYLVRNVKPSSIRTSFVCFCDSECSRYGDCCSDYNIHCRHRSNALRGQRDINIVQETKERRENDDVIDLSPTFSTDSDSIGTENMLECAHLDEVECGSLLVQTKCHANWKNKNIEMLCTDIDYHDDIAKLFVQGSDGITYRNIFCAACNFVKVFHFWIQDAYCHGELPTSAYEQPELLSDYLKRSCMTRFRVPFGQVFRPCLKMIDRCPEIISKKSEWLDQNCVSGHLSLVTTDIASTKLWGSMLYRNAFCAECNGVDQGMITCPTKDMLKNHFLHNNTHPKSSKPSNGVPANSSKPSNGVPANSSKPSNGERQKTNRIVTNYNMATTDQSTTVVYEENGLVVRIIDTCEDGQVFDPYLGKCRQLYCSDGYVLVKQNCVPNRATDEFDKDEIMHMVDAITTAINETVGLEDELVITVKIFIEWDYSDHVQTLPKLPLDRSVFNSSEWDLYVTPIHHNVSHSDKEQTDLACEVTLTMVFANPKEMNRNSAKQFADILGKLSDLNNANEMHIYVNGVCVKKQSDKDFTFLEIMNGNLTDLNYLISHCQKGNLTVLESSDFIIRTQGGDKYASSCPIVYVNSTSRVYDCYKNYIFGYDTSIPVNEQNFGAIVCDSQSPVDPTCERILLNETEYEILQNLSIITEGGAMYDPTEYFQTSEGILVCNVYANVISEIVVVFFDFTRAQTIMTYTGLVISSLCLSVTLLTYVIFGELRTLPGLNIMALMVASIGGNITFIISLSLTPGSMECQITAVIMHYFFLSRIFWTNANVVHAFQTFGPKIRGCTHRSFDVLRRSTARSRLRQHTPYALYAWCTPIVFTLLGSAWHFCACGPLPVYYGLYFSCWMADPYTFLYLFVLPLALLLTTNAILFVPIVYSLHTTRKLSSKKLGLNNKANVTKDGIKKPGEIGIYAKLSTTAGFSWLFGILASFTDQDFFWYLFILFMSLEGLFIFVSFFCTKRIKNLYSDQFGIKKCNGVYLARWSSGHSRGVYVISNQLERRTSSTPRETFTSLTL